MQVFQQEIVGLSLESKFLYVVVCKHINCAFTRYKNKNKENKNTQFLISKTSATAIALFLMFAMIVSIVALPPATAQSTRKTYAFVGAVPNPVGVGQEVLIHVGISHQLASALYGWEGLTVEVTRPDGHTETLGPFKTDATGGTGTVYVPNMAGNYTLQTHFPEQSMPVASGGTPEGTIMLASDSDELTLVVTEEPITYYQPHALPTEYWTRPIDAQLREWYTIAGNWLDVAPRNHYAPYNDDAPETAHILWTEPLRTGGGLVGGSLGDNNLEALGYHGFEEGDAYEGKFGGGTFFGGGNPLIIAGKLYYEKYAANDIYKETACVDLRTGKELWSRVLLNNQTITRGQLMYWDTYDYHGVYDYLWVAVGGGFFGPPVFTWHAFDPVTGDWVYTLEGIPSGTTVYGPKGEILIYNINLGNGWMTMWNSTNVPALYGSRDYASVNWGAWRPMGKTVNATGPADITREGQPYTAPTLPLGLNGYQWNKTIQTDLPGSAWAVFPLDKVVGVNVAPGIFGNVFGTSEIYEEVTSWAISLEPGKEGQLLYKKTWSTPPEWRTGNLTIDRAAISSEDGVFTLWAKELRKYYGFSTETGDFLWETEKPENYLQLYVSTSNAIADGKLYSTGASGVTRAYDITTGDILWEYHANDAFSEILWANDWWTEIQFIADGKIYLGHQEHSPVDPKPRGAPFICLNATTGEEIWRADGLFRQTGWGGLAIIGDSIIATMDTYDQRIYAIGKGPSDTTVSIQNDVITYGSSVLVKGMVTDISPGTEEYALRARFPDGVPAVSDANISDWMLYVHKQFERPADVMGVDLIVSVVDPNNNVYEVGRTASDSTGAYSLAFTPEVPGKYTVIASFDGSGAYYGSFAETALSVEEAPAATPEPTPMPASAADLYFVPAVIGIIVAIIVVGLLLFLLLRKR
jgi:outer membrane protein assembly factor BamB